MLKIIFSIDPWASAYMCTLVHMHPQTHTFTHTYAKMYTHTYTRTHTHIYTHTQTYALMQVHTYTHRNGKEEKHSTNIVWDPTRSLSFLTDTVTCACKEDSAAIVLRTVRG